ncbi:hypothetical protein WOLCODRAFT_120805 [Wolfiporia cocos MD-104 SS10]|uniref:Uncharacterized protein n=1 Tax=Wolfiporia cocos (strain MD-104) TaxID=742152 RepID=A0A2H3JL53_WOLCO|nr:hypothetical protein WOLCODRAFT_120805 [Wolfiporia cocos MD-104 SS10]
MRIASHGQINAYVTFALDFFQKNPEKSLTLHTLPAAKDRDKAAIPAPENKPRMHPSTNTIPRLISVVEIIKREYLKTLDSVLTLEGRLSGLHQYNEIGELEVDDADDAQKDAEERRQKEIIQAMQGKRHLKQRKVAIMRVTLCRKQLPHLMAKGATYQQPALRSLSRAARARLRRKAKRVSVDP